MNDARRSVGRQADDGASSVVSLVKTVERTSWGFFFVLSRPALVAERAGTEMAQLDGKVLISAETALDVELVAVIATEMVDVALKMVVISAEIVVKPQFSDI